MKRKVVWITGASTGIGAETALQMAEKGWVVAVTARSKDKLAALVGQAEPFDGAIVSYPGDVTKEKRMTEIVEKIEAEQGVIDMALLNAGRNTPDTANNFTAESFKKIFDVNVNGVAHCIEPLLKKFRLRGAGHIAIVASVAGYRGLPTSLSYGPTKAALINMAEALYMECKPLGIKVQLVNPGFVKTPLTDKNKFPMPMLMPVEKAATKLIRGLQSNRFEINFPWLFTHILRAAGFLPNKLYLAFMMWVTKGKV